MRRNKEKQKFTSQPVSRHQKKLFFVIGVMTLLVMTASFLFAHSLKVQLYELRSVSLGQTTEKIVQIMNTVIDNEWDRLRYVSHELSRTPQATQKELLNRLSDYYYHLERQLSSWRLSCIDSNGNLYCWDGQIDRWFLPDMLLEDRSDYQITIMEARGSDNERLAFIYRLPEPIQLTQDDVLLTHTVLTFDMSAFGEMLEISAFEGNSYSYITEKNGARLYHQQNQTEFIAAYNIMTAMQHSQFLYDENYANLEAAALNATTYTAEIEREGQRYFVSYSPLSINNWCLFLFVPEANVGGDTSDFVQVLLIEVALISLLLIVLISTFVWTNSRQTVAKQQVAVDEAYRATQAKSVFLSHMSHDIRTPLNGIMGMCHIAKQHIGDNEAMLDCLNKIDFSSLQLMALINDVLDMSRIEQDKVEIRCVPVDLNDVIRACALHIEVSVQENEVSFEQDTSGVCHPLVCADPVLLDKVLTNILGNAAKFTSPGGKIRLCVSETEGDAARGIYRFEIADSGIGMHPEFLAHLFEPFSQEHSGTRTQYKGTGLGLSIVKSLVDKLGGNITVDSVLGEGSVFTVSLPLDYADQADFPTEKEVAKPDVSGLHALLVEDNELNCIIAKHILEECGLTVDTVADGAAAVERFQNSEPGEYDLIFMDLRMPVMDGLEASRRIRSLTRADAADVPIIALTADTMSDDTEKTFNAGMNEHLGKPIDLNKLYAILRKYYQKGKKT